MLDLKLRRMRSALSNRHAQLYRSSFALILTTVLNGLLGLVFWVAAAHLYSAKVVGLGAGGVSALQLVSTVGWVGLQFTLLRYIPVAASRRRLLLLNVYIVGAGAASIAAFAFVLWGTRFLGVPFISHQVLGSAVFCLSSAMRIVFSLQDAALIAARRAIWVPVENAGYGVLKLLMLCGLSFLAGPWTILGVWVGATVVMVIAVNTYLFSSGLGRPSDEPKNLPSKL